MRANNNVGGYRIYPTSPQAAELYNAGLAILGQFNEGMDRLNAERQLSDAQEHVVSQLDPNSELATKHQHLITVSNRLWQHALEKQQALANYDFSGQYTTEQLGDLMNQCANKWQEFKHQLDAHA